MRARAPRSDAEAAASAASKWEVASARSPRRWWTCPIRCSTLGQQLGRAVGGGRLVAGERVGVVAAQRVEVADRGVQRGGVAVAEGERGAQVLERLGVGEQRAGVVGGAGVGLGRLGVAAGEPEVAGDRRRGAGERVGGAAVEEAAAREARLLVDERAQPLVPEVVVEAALADQPAADELLERADGLLLAAAAGGAHGPDVERAPDHGRRGEHLARGLADRVEAPEQQLARARGKRPRRVGVERVEVLDEQERQPFGLLVQAPGELGARRRAASP